MKIEILPHAQERMQVYGISKEMVIKALDNPDSLIKGYGNRSIAQKNLDGYILRIIYEESENTKIVITVYKARSGRYEI